MRTPLPHKSKSHPPWTPIASKLTQPKCTKCTPTLPPTTPHPHPNSSNKCTPTLPPTTPHPHPNPSTKFTPTLPPSYERRTLLATHKGTSVGGTFLMKGSQTPRELATAFVDLRHPEGQKARSELSRALSSPESHFVSQVRVMLL